MKHGLCKYLDPINAAVLFVYLYSSSTSCLHEPVMLQLGVRKLMGSKKLALNFLQCIYLYAGLHLGNGSRGGGKIRFHKGGNKIMICVSKHMASGEV